MESWSWWFWWWFWQILIILGVYMLSKFLHSIKSIIDLIAFISIFINALLLWFPVINNMILNYSVFGFRNIKTHMLNVVVIFLQILLFVHLGSDNIIVAYIILIPWLIYMTNGILYFKRESKLIFYTICVILILFMIWIIYSIVTHGLHNDFFITIMYCSFIFEMTLLMSNLYLLKGHSINKYLKYITILISVTYVTALAYCCFDFALHPPK